MKETKKRFKVPHTYVILSIVVLIMTVCTWILPTGEYDRVEVDGRTVVDASSYHAVDANPIGFFDLFKEIPKGFNDGATVIFFIFCTAGMFNIIMASGAIERGIGKLALATRGKEKLLIPVVMAVFALAGATFGINEETIIFVPVGIALARALGYDAIVGMSIVMLGASIGFSSGIMNAFTVGVAQGIAELPIFSGYGLRIAVWVVMLIVTVIYVSRYAKKVKGNPTLSYVRDLEVEEHGQSMNLDTLEKMNKRDILILLWVSICFGIMIFGTFNYGWYMTELFAMFVIMGIGAGILAGFGPSKIATEFVNGAKSIVFGALVVGVARTILMVMSDGMIIDSVLHALSGVIAYLPKSVAAVGMLFVQAITNFFIPSGSGQAAATMPLMTPLADVLGLTRQTAVLAFQFGDGFTNNIIPTSSVLMGCLAAAYIPYEKWVKYIAPLMGIWVCICAVFMIIATAINYGPF